MGKIFDKLRIQGHMHFFVYFAEIRVSESLIDGFRSWECQIRHQLDLLYNLNFSNPQKVDFRPERRIFHQKVVPQGPFGQNI